MSSLQFVPLAVLLLSVLTSTVVVVWKLSSMDTKVDLILTNHLPHLDADIKEIRADILVLHDKL